MKALHRPNFFDDIPQGPQRSKEHGHSSKKQRSKVLKRMLQAPAAGIGSSAATPFSRPSVEKTIVHVEKTDAKPHCCLFLTRKGDRCSKARVGEMFCGTHEKVFASDKMGRAMQLLAKKFPDHRLAPQAFQRWMTQLAVKRSLAAKKKDMDTEREAQTLLQFRFFQKNERCLESRAGGFCFFFILSSELLVLGVRLGNCAYRCVITYRKRERTLRTFFRMVDRVSIVTWP